MLLKCPKICSLDSQVSPFGSYFRKSDSKKVRRWRCKSCGATVSEASNSQCYGQKKRRLNPEIRRMFLLKGSQRRIAFLLKINRKTVARKLTFLGLKAHENRQNMLLLYRKAPAQNVQFDDMITFQHTKLKPVAISLIVEDKTRKILDFEVSSMAANGKLAALSVKKYGKRKDERKMRWRSLFERSQNYISDQALMESDEHPFYPKLVKRYFPQAQHKTYKGRRACVVGQGELKAHGKDPLFSLNHSCAMIRDSIGRLVRRTWCTTKNLNMLRTQLEIYIDFHNSEITQKQSA